MRDVREMIEARILDVEAGMQLATASPCAIAERMALCEANVWLHAARAPNRSAERIPTGRVGVRVVPPRG